MISLWLNLMRNHGVTGVIIAYLSFMAVYYAVHEFIGIPLRNRFMVTRAGWRLHVSWRWYRVNAIVLLDGEPLRVIDWWQASAGDPPITWVYTMAADIPEDDSEDWDGRLGWVVLESLRPGPSRKVWRRVLREGAAS